MAELTLNTGLLILIFWVVVPTVDQYSDLGLVFRLYTGPEEDLMVSGGRCHESFCNIEVPCHAKRSLSRSTIDFTVD